MHVEGFIRRPSSGVAAGKRGTYAGMIEKIPHPAYGSRQDPQGPLDEFRDLVKALHRAGLEVILDVVFNHTAEGNENGPTLRFRGIENEAHDMLDCELPPLAQGDDMLWRRWIDTALESPNDVAPWAKSPAVPGLTYRAEARSVVVLYAPAA